MIPLPPPFNFWSRHTASVPKGFVRYHVLKMLNKRAMSGSELMNAIEKETEGRWKPSPGSIYPLLTWLKENGYVVNVASENPHIKRYRLTAQGEKFYQEHTELKAKFENGPGMFLVDITNEVSFGREAQKVQSVFFRFIRTAFRLRRALRKSPSTSNIKKFHDFFEDISDRAEELIKSLEQK
ncbi:MAG: PadR family transcriptional regulator [Candidatus Ranarchaeia archaeon]